MSIVGEITPASAARAIAEIAAAPANRPLRICIDSVGGDIVGATEIAEVIKRHEGPTSATLIKCESAANLIAAAVGGEVVIARDGTVLLHAPAFSAHGVTLNVLPFVEGALRKSINDLAEAIAVRTRKNPASYYRYLMEKNNGEGERFDAERSVLHGLADRVSAWPSAHIRSGREP